MHYYTRIENHILTAIFTHYSTEMDKNDCMVFSNFIITDNDVFARVKFWSSFVLYLIKFELWMSNAYETKQDGKTIERS